MANFVVNRQLQDVQFTLTLPNKRTVARCNIFFPSQYLNNICPRKITGSGCQTHINAQLLYCDCVALIRGPDSEDLYCESRGNGSRRQVSRAIWTSGGGVFIGLSVVVVCNYGIVYIGFYRLFGSETKMASLAIVGIIYGIYLGNKILLLDHRQGRLCYAQNQQTLINEATRSILTPKSQSQNNTVEYGKFFNVRVPGWERAEGLNQYDGAEAPW